MKNLIEARRMLQVDLADVDGATFSPDELDRCYQRAVDDLSRFFPDEACYEQTLVFSITDEAFTTASAHGTYASLANKPIKYQSEVVTNAAGTTTYTRDTDYYIDYSNGKITTISGGSMVVSTAYKISYDKSNIALDISSVSDLLIRISRVEYPVGSVPQKFVSYAIAGNLLYIGSMDSKTNQQNLSANNHIAIYYDKAHTMPTTSAAGSYPSYLDQVICLGATAYAIYMKAIQQELQAITDLASARTAIGSISAILTAAEANLTSCAAAHTASGVALTALAAIHTAAQANLTSIAAKHTSSATALGKVITYLESQSSENANFWLGKITTDAATLRTLIASVLASAEAEIALVNTDLTNAAAIANSTQTTAATSYLETGDDKINVVNIGTDVAAEYRQYAAAELAIANIFSDNKNALMESATKRSAVLANATQAAATRLNLLDTYIAESEAYRKIAETFIYESTGWLGEMDRYISEANARLSEMDKYLSEAGTHQSDIDRYIAEANVRLSETSTLISEAVNYISIAQQSLYASDKLRADADAKRNEFWTVLRDKAEWRKKNAFVPTVQTK